jgi:hypothetical protein
MHPHRLFQFQFSSMFFSRALCIVYKTTGGRRWIPSSGLPPLTPTQRRTRRGNVEQTLKNISVIKMAAANGPQEATRLYKPLNHWRLLWLRGRLDQSRTTLGWSNGTAGANRTLDAKLRALAGALAPSSAPAASR